MDYRPGELALNKSPLHVGILRASFCFVASTVDLVCVALFSFCSGRKEPEGTGIYAHG